jgi:hypothetical protein
MKQSLVRVLNPAGLGLFAQYLEAGPWKTEKPPIELLEDLHSVVLEPEVEVGTRRFSSKFEMGMEVCSAIEPERLTALWANDGLWAALSLTFHQSTFPVKDGQWFVGSPSRHIVARIPGRLQDQSHRHLVKGAAIAVSRFGADARVLMGGPHQQAKIEEQIMSRKADMGLASANEVVRAAYQLYYDPDADAVKRGAKSTGAGSIMRLIDVLAQLDVNYDIPSLEANEIIALLPKKEFGKFLPRSTSKV